MPRQRRSKSLEKVARSIKDSDEFVEHVFGIAARYRSHYELETGTRGREIRQAIKLFEKHAAALGEWLHRAQKSSTAEHEALGVLSSALHGSAAAVRPQAIATELWLHSAAGASERALTTLKRSPLQGAPRAAAEALRATFEHHGLKSIMAPAVQQVLQSIAALQTDRASESGARQGNLQEALELFYGQGLLQLKTGRDS